VCLVSEMADRKSSSGSRLTVRRKEKAENEAKKEEKPPKEGEKPEVNGKNAPVENGEAAAAAASAENGAAANGDKPEPMELPPFEIIKG